MKDLINKIPSDLTWWEYAAIECYRVGHCHCITRADGEPYLSRFWLSKPTKRDADGIPWESSNSILLHYFHTGDDADALHDHPWPFTTRILAGGYMEARPPIGWPHGHQVAIDHRCIANCGPAIKDWVNLKRGPGDSTHLDSNTPHCVTHVEPGTWTMVTTGHFYGHSWGFYPPEKPRVEWRQYLDVGELTHY